MMEKRLILAIILSALILLVWNTLFYKPVTQPVALKDETPSSLPMQAVSTQEEELEQESVPLLSFPQEKFDIVFKEPQAAIKEVIFKDYQSQKFPLKSGFMFADNNLLFRKESFTTKEAVFVQTDKDKEIIKRFLISNYNYNIELEIKVKNLSNAPLNINLPLVLGILDFNRGKTEVRAGSFQDITVSTPEKTLHFNGQKDKIIPNIQFLGLRDRYFCVIIEPTEKADYLVEIKKTSAKESRVVLRLPEEILSPGQQIGHKFRVYLGPQDLKLINAAHPAWSSVLYYGAFDFISHLLLMLLDKIYLIVRNWGLAIIILSIAIYFLLYPLSLKQMRSMKEMQVLQPAVEELRKLYKDNPQRLNKEIMELYRRHKINPLGGCLPLLLQLPIFFALYQALMRSISLKGARFLWIKDLSEPDRLFILSVGGSNIEINLLPILMAFGMLIQQKISLAKTGAGSNEQQKFMTIAFPIIFGFIFYRMPAGLVLYWFVNSALMLIYQLRINRAEK